MKSVKIGNWRESSIMIVCFMLLIEFISYCETYASVALEQTFVPPFDRVNAATGRMDAFRTQKL